MITALRLLLVLTIWSIVPIAFAQPKTQKHETHNMVKIPAGVFTTFYKAQAPSDTVRVKPFMMDITPVTNEQYLAFVKARPEWRRSKVKRIYADSGYLQTWSSDTVIGNRVALNSPVVNVSWFAARAYCQWLGRQLPTIAQWEYAGAKPPQGKSQKDLSRLILDWYSKPNAKVLPPVKSTFKNGFGLYDMHGLIWEWTSDFNTVLLSSDDRSTSSGDDRMFCGAGAINAKDFENYAAYMRYAFRSSLKANSTVRNLGFRTVKPI